MAVQDVLKYLEDNRAKYSNDFLIGELRKNGYPENEIAAALDELKKKDLPMVPEEKYKVFSWLAGFFCEEIISGFIMGIVTVIGISMGNLSSFYAIAVMGRLAILTLIYYVYIMKLGRKSLARGYFTALCLSCIGAIWAVFIHSISY